MWIFFNCKLEIIWWWKNQWEVCIFATICCNSNNDFYNTTSKKNVERREFLFDIAWLSTVCHTVGDGWSLSHDKGLAWFSQVQGSALNGIVITLLIINRQQSSLFATLYNYVVYLKRWYFDTWKCVINLIMHSLLIVSIATI